MLYNEQVKEIIINFKRSNLIESSHKIKALILDINKKTLFSSKNDNEFIYPRSSIKIFQAIPFIESNAYKHYKLSSKQIALACSSHRGEKFHISELTKWVNKIGISKKNLLCGIHNPLNLKASENLFRLNKIANQLHNNCAGKHLAMISNCLINKYNITNYLDFNHPHQLKIRKIFEIFSKYKILKKNFGIDGCSAPQYSFRVKDIGNMLINLVKSYNGQFYYNNEIKILINSVIDNPNYIGGTDSLDSKIMSMSNKKIFCKGGAEGVFLFADLNQGIAGVIKVADGNERAIPYVIHEIFKEFKILDKKTLNNFNKIYRNELINHAGIKVGKIETKL